MQEVTLAWGNEEDEFEDKEVFFAAVIGVQFTAPSTHFLSPEYNRETAIVELPLPLPHEGDRVSTVLLSLLNVM